MPKSSRFTLCFLLSATCATVIGLFSTSSLWARTVVDHLNRTVEVPDKIERIVVADIYPLASLAAVLSRPEAIVGTHPVSMSAAKNGLLGKIRPQVLKADTSFMKGSEANIESLMALAPDVIFVNASNKTLVSRLEASGLNAVAVSATRENYNVFATFESWVQMLRDVLGDSVNAARISSYAQRISALVNERTKEIKAQDKKRVLFLVQYDARRIVTSGSRFFGQFWCDAAAAVNAAESITAENANAVINIEQVYAWNPDVVFLTNFTRAAAEDLLKNRMHDWSSVKAVQEKAVYKMPLGLYRSYTPSADSPLTLLWMAKTLYPDRFKDIDMTKETLAYYKELFGLELDQETARRLFAVH